MKQMSKDLALSWAITTIAKLLNNPALRLHRHEAMHAAACMTVLSGKTWQVRKRQGVAGEYWQCYQDTSTPTQPTNLNRGGTI